MNDVPESNPTAPAAWHPDPSGARQLRYWDGLRWTDHVAPYPSTQPANAAATTAEPDSAPAATAHPQPGGTAQPQDLPRREQPHRTQPGQKVMTRMTWGVLAVTALVVVGTVGTVGWTIGSANAAAVSEAPDVLDAFLAAATADDPGWTEYASPGYVAVSGSATPLFGDADAAEELGLSVSYETRDILYGVRGTAGNASPAGADSARALVDLTYEFAADETVHTATSTRAIWLTRPYYYGDDAPSGVRDGETPTAIGPWRVTGAAPPPTYQEEIAETTTFAPAAIDQACYSSEIVLSQMSEIARRQGALAPVCLSGGASTMFGDDVDIDALAASFPVITSETPLTDLMGWADDPNMPSAIEQYRLTAGDVDYVFVLASTAVGGAITSDSERRIILIEKAETR